MKSVLLIDDSNHDSFKIIRMLMSEGYNVVHKNDANAGVDAAINTVPDLVLMDIMMPEMDGYEAIDKIRATEKGKDIPFIVQTGRNEDYESDFASMAGAASILIKPIEKADLLKAVKRIIGSP